MSVTGQDMRDEIQDTRYYCTGKNPVPVPYQVPDPGHVPYPDPDEVPHPDQVPDPVEFLVPEEVTVKSQYIHR